MPDQTPAQELRTAAERLRWLLHPDGMPEQIRRSWTAPADGPHGRITAPGEDQPVAVAFWGGVAEYAATMHPGVGAALADWLELTADVINSRTIADPSDEYTVDISDDHALAVARALLGQVTE